VQLYLDNVYHWFRLPRKIITDHDPRFTSHFGQALTAKLGVQQNLSTMFHPQTNGLAERTNQWIEQYLRLITGAQPNNWSKWLTIASAVHNDRQNSTLEMSPNQALLGYRPVLYPNQIIGTNSEEAEGRIDEML
jgi:transposase InsO family protein